MWPATRSWFSGAEPRYGTNWNFVPVTSWKYAPFTSEAPPTPTVPAVALPSRSFSQPTSSLRSFGGSEFRAVSQIGVSANTATGSKSFSTSNGKFMVAPSTTWVFQCPMLTV